MLVKIESMLRQTETLWYPACGDDLRPVHHVAFNNIYVNPKWIVMNDVNPSLDLSMIERIEGFSVHSRVRRSFGGVPVQLFKISFEVDGRRRMKNIIYFPMTNWETYNVLLRENVIPKTALLHRLNDAFTRMEIGWLEALRTLGVQYCYTDNWFMLSLGDGSTFQREIAQTGIRYISKQSYTGFRFSEPDMVVSSRLALNNCFDSTIHLFELSSRG
jgi:hypothetical protein